MISSLLLLYTVGSLFSQNKYTPIEMFDVSTSIPKTEKLVAPIKWSEGNKKEGKIDYYLVQENGNTFLRGEYLPKTTGKIIRLKKRLKFNNFKYLSWKWRAKKFPNLKTLDGVEEPDNVATVYVLFKKKWGTKFIIKYDWSQHNCKTKHNGGNPFYFRSKSSRTSFSEIYIRPLRCTNSSITCCNDPVDKWVAEKVNLLEDFKMLFNRKGWIPEYIEGLGILVDGDDTSTAGVSADFDDFILSSE